MAEAAFFGWGMMIGSWITSLWIMRRHREPMRSAADTMLESMAVKVASALTFAPDCKVEVYQCADIHGKRYRITVEPDPVDEHPQAGVG